MLNVEPRAFERIVAQRNRVERIFKACLTRAALSGQAHARKQFRVAISRVIRLIDTDNSILRNSVADLHSLQSAPTDKKRTNVHIDVQGLGFPLTAALLEHTKRRLRFAMTRTSARIKRVVVRLSDSTALRGSVDKCCRIQVHMELAPPIVIEDTGADLYALIDRVTERAGRNVAKRVDRLNENACGSRLKPSAVRSRAIDE